jgi:predicted nicotinamide N-methyase
MEIPLQLKQFVFGATTINLYVPDPDEIQHHYTCRLSGESGLSFPFWAKIWPAAMAMASYLEKKPYLYAGKSTLELAAGLGLPSLLMARLAARVICSDNQPAAENTMRKSVMYNRFDNTEVLLLNWNNIPETIQCDLLILSDINYDPSVFPELTEMVTRFTRLGTRVLLATPQRLMAKPFITSIQPFISDQEVVQVNKRDEQLPISVFLLQ